jgi:hypothetical protein
MLLARDTRQPGYKTLFQVVVDKAIVSLGSLDSNLRLELEMNLHDPTASQLEEEIETEFFFR